MESQSAAPTATAWAYLMAYWMVDSMEGWLEMLQAEQMDALLAVKMVEKWVTPLNVATVAPMADLMDCWKDYLVAMLAAMMDQPLAVLKAALWVDSRGCLDEMSADQSAVLLADWRDNLVEMWAVMTDWKLVVLMVGLLADLSDCLVGKMVGRLVELSVDLWESSVEMLAVMMDTLLVALMACLSVDLWDCLDGMLAEMLGWLQAGLKVGLLAVH